MYWLDVRESYFNGYRECMNPFYKDAFGRICVYKEMKNRALYREPSYLSDTRIEADACLLLMKSNEEYRVVKRQLQSLNRAGVLVSVLIKFKNVANILNN